MGQPNAQPQPVGQATHHQGATEAAMAQGRDHPGGEQHFGGAIDKGHGRAEQGQAPQGPVAPEGGQIVAKAAGRLGPGDCGLAPVLLAWRRGRPQGCFGPGGQEHAGHGKAKTQAIEHQHAPQAGNPHKPGPQKRRRDQYQSIAAGKQAIGPVARHPRRYQQGDQAGKTKHQAGLGRGRQPLQGQ